MNPYYRCFEASDGFVAVACLNLVAAARLSRPVRAGGRDRSTHRTSYPTTRSVDAQRSSSPTRSCARSRSSRSPSGSSCSSRPACRAAVVQQRETIYADPQVAAERLIGQIAQPGLGDIDLLAPFVRVGGEAPGARPRSRARCRHRRRSRGARDDVRGVRRSSTLFAESVRAAIGDWHPPREPELGGWQDDRDDALAERVIAAGWTELWGGEELLGAVVAGGIELGRAAAPVCLVDEATLGAPLWVDGRARHARASRVARGSATTGGGLGLGTPSSEARPELTLDGTGTVLVEVSAVGQLEDVAAASCWRAWNAATLAYLAGLVRACARARGRARANARAVRSSSRGAAGGPVATRRRRARDGRDDAARLGGRARTRAGSRSRSFAGREPPAATWSPPHSRFTARSGSPSRRASTCTTGVLDPCGPGPIAACAATR